METDSEEDEGFFLAIANSLLTQAKERNRKSKLMEKFVVDFHWTRMMSLTPLEEPTDECEIPTRTEEETETLLPSPMSNPEVMTELNGLLWRHQVIPVLPASPASPRETPPGQRAQAPLSGVTLDEGPEGSPQKSRATSAVVQPSSAVRPLRRLRRPSKSPGCWQS